jgi:hypothetical protein
MNAIDYITITCNLKNVWLQITFDYNRLRLQITITPCLVWMYYDEFNTYENALFWLDN